MKRFFSIIFGFCFVIIFSACSLGNGPTNQGSNSSAEAEKSANFLKSSDGGKKWENKVRINETKNIGLFNMLSLEIDSLDSNIIYLGTEKDGLFVTKNGAESWEKLVFPLTKIYGIATGNLPGRVIYASGILDKRAKIYKSLDDGLKWEEIYSEPINDSVISSLAIEKNNPNILYCGTSEGVIFKTTDGGKSWRNLTKVNGPVISIAFDAKNNKTVYFAVSGGSVYRTLNGGEKIEDLSKLSLKNISQGTSINWSTYSIATDPINSGIIYMGTSKGLLRGKDFGNKWEEMNIIESSKNFPIRAIALNPKNSNEIIYGNSGIIYYSQDGGKSWTTSQLKTENSVQTIKHDSSGLNVYAGLRKM